MKNNKNKSEHKGKSKKSLKDKELPRVSGGIGNIDIDINAYGMVEPDHEEFVINEYGNVMPYRQKSINLGETGNTLVSSQNSGNNNLNFNFKPRFKE